MWERGIVGEGERKWRVVLLSLEISRCDDGLDYRLGGTLIGNLTLRCSNTHFLSVLICGGGERGRLFRGF